MHDLVFRSFDDGIPYSHSSLLFISSHLKMESRVRRPSTKSSDETGRSDCTICPFDLDPQNQRLRQASQGEAGREMSHDSTQLTSLCFCRVS